MIKKQDPLSRTLENEIMDQFSHHLVPMNQILHTYDRMRDPLSRDLLRDLYETRRTRLIREAESNGAFAIAEAVKSSEYDLQNTPSPEEE